MTLSLAQNIRKFRKKRKLTQEQLAEAMGVTLGAVYKWEAGQSVPELNLILQLAEFFGISTDVLLGYEGHSCSANQTLVKLQDFRREKQYEAGTAAAKKALQSYPNHFAIIYECAQLFYEKAILEQHQRDCETALKLLDRACEQMEQNTDNSISELSIRNQMAQLHFMLGHTDTCLDILKRYNFCGINNARIGSILADSYHKTEEAKEYLMKSFRKLIQDLDAVVIGFTTVFWTKKDYTSLISVIQWLRILLRGQQCSEEAIWFDKYDCVLLAIEAEADCMAGNPERAKQKLREARDLALRFDGAADVQMPQLLKKLGAAENHYMAYGASAWEAAERRVLTDAEIVPQLPKLWEQVKAEVLRP